MLSASLIAGCAPASEASRQVAEICARSPRLVGKPEAQVECRQALAEAQAPDRVRRVTNIAGERPDRVVDRAGVLDLASERKLTERLIALEAATTDQVVIATVPTLDGLPIEQFALALGMHWRVGQADADNGVLLLIAPAERKVRVEVGCGLESLLTDASTATIVAEMVPRFREGDLAAGIEHGVARIDAVLKAQPGPRYGC